MPRPSAAPPPRKPPRPRHAPLALRASAVRTALLLAAAFCLAAAPAPEPDGLWTGPERGPVPATLSGGRVVDTPGLAALLQQGATLVDVSAAQRRPVGLQPGAIWLPLPHRDIATGTPSPGSAPPAIDPPAMTPATRGAGSPAPAAPGAGSNGAWLPDAGQPALTDAAAAWLRARLVALTGGDRARPLVFYCHPECWRSWNAARRAIGWGYRDVLWYPEGVEGWSGAGRPLAAATPEDAP